MNWIRWTTSITTCALFLGCAMTPGEEPEAEVESHAAALSTDLTTPPPPPPPPTAPDDLTSRPRTEELHWGCNHNTSCRANCEWCGIRYCTCRLKGVP